MSAKEMFAEAKKKQRGKINIYRKKAEKEIQKGFSSQAYFKLELLLPCQHK